MSEKNKDIQRVGKNVCAKGNIQPKNVRQAIDTPRKKEKIEQIRVSAHPLRSSDENDLYERQSV